MQMLGSQFSTVTFTSTYQYVLDLAVAGGGGGGGGCLKILFSSLVYDDTYCGLNTLALSTVSGDLDL